MCAVSNGTRGRDPELNGFFDDPFHGFALEHGHLERERQNRARGGRRRELDEFQARPAGLHAQSDARGLSLAIEGFERIAVAQAQNARDVIGFFFGQRLGVIGAREARTENAFHMICTLADPEQRP